MQIHHLTYRVAHIYWTFCMLIGPRQWRHVLSSWVYCTNIIWISLMRTSHDPLNNVSAASLEYTQLVQILRHQLCRLPGAICTQQHQHRRSPRRWHFPCIHHTFLTDDVMHDNNVSISIRMAFQLNDWWDSWRVAAPLRWWLFGSRINIVTKTNDCYQCNFPLDVQR